MMLTAEDRKKMEDIISYSAGLYSYGTLNTDNLLAKWAENKKHFYKLFGEKLIVEIPIVQNLEIDSAELANLWEKFKANYNYKPFIDYLDSLTLEEFLSNMQENDYVEKSLCIPKGTKVIKNFRYFFAPDEKEYLRAVQDEASRIIQKAKLTGTLCLSIHPIDFLTSSENNSNWRSCHSLDGEYRGGNLSYMTDDCTIITYVKSNNDVALESFDGNIEWNNKKWRMLVHMTPDFSFAVNGRQYPFSCKGAKDGVLAEIHKMLHIRPNDLYQPHDDEIKWSDDYVNSTRLSDKYFYRGLKLYGLKDYVKNASNIALNYNDVLYSSFYRPSYTNLKAYKDLKPLNVGGLESPPCPRCGEGKVTEPGQLLCNNCAYEYGDREGLARCACCHEIVGIDYSVYMSIYEETICETCFNNETYYCECCGENVYADDYDHDRECCRWCLDEI